MEYKEVVLWLVLMFISGLSFIFGYRLGKIRGELDSYSKMLERLDSKNDKTPYSDLY